MKFGAVSSMKNRDLSLPPDHEVNAIDINPNRGSLEIFVGGTQWTQPQWKGKWYPPKVLQRNFLEAYSELFNTIEGNATHYRIYDREKFSDWARRLPPDFKFCPKLPQTISHYRRLLNTGDAVEQFIDGIGGLGSKLGPCFLQMPANYTTWHSRRLLAFLDDWPEGVDLAVEVRHSSWFADQEPLDELVALCYDRGIGMVVTDTPGRRDALHMALTNNFLLLRFAGHSLHSTDYQRMNDWVDRLASWKTQGLQQVYIFMHQPEGLLTPEAVAYFGNRLIKRFNSPFRYTASPPFDEQNRGN